MADLESKLVRENTKEIRDAVVSQLASRRYEKAASMNNPYFKYNLIPSIVDRINDYAPTGAGFVSNLNSQLNKDEAKRVFTDLSAWENLVKK